MQHRSIQIFAAISLSIIFCVAADHPNYKCISYTNYELNGGDDCEYDNESESCLSSRSCWREKASVVHFCEPTSESTTCDPGLNPHETSIWLEWVDCEENGAFSCGCMDWTEDNINATLPSSESITKCL
jgi:hypothetical protein